MFKRLWQQRTWSSSTSSAGRFIVAFCYLVTAMHICAWNDQLGFPHKMLTLIFSCAFYTAKWIITQVPHDLMTPWFNQNIIWMKMFDTKLDCEKWERTSGGGFTMFVMWYTWLEFKKFSFFSKQTFDFCEKMRGIFVIACSWSRFLRHRLSVSHLRLVRSLLNWQSLFMQGKYSFNARRRSNNSNHIYFRSFSTLIAVYLMFHKSINVHADSMFMKSSSLSCWRLCLCISCFFLLNISFDCFSIFAKPKSLWSVWLLFLSKFQIILLNVSPNFCPPWR